MHGQNGRRLLAQPLATRFHEGHVEGRSVTITDEFRIASGYGSVMVLVNGLEPLPIRLQGDRSTIGAKPAYLAGQRGLEPR